MQNFIVGILAAIVALVIRFVFYPENTIADYVAPAIISFIIGWFWGNLIDIVRRVRRVHR